MKPLRVLKQIVSVLGAMLVVTASQAAPIPAGFATHVVRRGETPLSIVKQPGLVPLFLRVNRIDAQHLETGHSVLVPVGPAAQRYVPVARRIKGTAPRELVIYKQIQYFGYYQQGKLVRWGPVSTASPKPICKDQRHPGHYVHCYTPVGQFHIGYKSVDKVSHTYNNAPMPYAMHIVGGVFFHGEVLRGHPTSHGCIRTLIPLARWLYHHMRRGDLVVVTN